MEREGIAGTDPQKQGYWTVRRSVWLKQRVPSAESGSQAAPGGQARWCGALTSSPMSLDMSPWAMGSP